MNNLVEGGKDDEVYDKDLVNAILQSIGESKNVLNLGGNQASQILRKNNFTFDKISIPESCELDQSQFPKTSYDTIFLANLVEKAKDPKTLLENISYHFKDIKIVGFIYNFSYIINIGKILDGNFLQEQLTRNNKNIFFNLESLILFLNIAGFFLTKLIRVKKKIDINNPKPLKDYVYNREFLETILKDPESTTFQYVFVAKPNSNIDVDTKRSLVQFPKNIISESLKDSFENLKQKISEQESKIRYLENAIKEKDAYEKGLENAIKEKDAYEKGLENAIKEKDAYLENAIKEKDAYLENAIKEKDAYLENTIKEKDAYLENVIKEKDMYEKSLENKLDLIYKSKTWRFLRKLDKLLGK